MLDYEVRKGMNGKMTWKDFSENLVSGCYGPDQVYYKYKTDYWHEGGGFPTPSKKFEFKSNHLESLGYDPLPVFTEPGESPVSTPELYKEYPLLLSTGFRQPFYFLGQYRNIPWLRSYMEFPQCQMHPETAKEYGVEDGDIIWIETQARPDPPEAARVPRDQEGHDHGHRQLVLSGGAGEGVPRRVHLEPQRADQQRPPRPDVRLARHDVPHLQGLQDDRRGPARTACSRTTATARCRRTTKSKPAPRGPSPGPRRDPPAAAGRSTYGPHIKQRYRSVIWTCHSVQWTDQLG